MEMLQNTKLKMKNEVIFQLYTNHLSSIRQHGQSLTDTYTRQHSSYRKPVKTARNSTFALYTCIFSSLCISIRRFSGKLRHPRGNSICSIICTPSVSASRRQPARYNGRYVSLLAVSTMGEAYVMIAGRRDREISSRDAFLSEIDRWQKRDKSSMKFPAARLDGVRGISSWTVTSYG